MEKRNIIETDARIICDKIDFSIFNNKTVLITGASGLLGVYFLTCLKIITQRSINVKTVAVFRSELPEYLIDKSFTNLQTLKGDITDYEFAKNLPAADFIIHAAGYGQPTKFMAEPEKTLKINTFSTFILFEKLKFNGRFLFISSSEVYSGLHKKAYKEEDIGTTNTSHPRACYIEGKRGGEAICNAYRAKGISASSVRLAHTYGPGTKMNDKRVILSFIEKALQGKIQMLDDGVTKRTYCYIGDAIEIMWKILLSGKHDIYNLAGNSQTTIAGLGKQIGEILNVPVIIPVNKNGVTGAPDEVQLDTTRVKDEFAKKDYLALPEGLKRTIDWYLDIRNNKTNRI